MVTIVRATSGMVLAALIACGGVSKRDGRPDGSGAGGMEAIDNGGVQAQAGRGDGGSSTGGSRHSAGSGGSGVIVTGEPESCTTGAGELGMLVDIFPYPAGVAECLALDHPGDEDSSCPSDGLYVCDPIDCYRAVDMPGCCRPDGTCGLREEGYFSFERKLGCVSREPWLENERFLGRTLEPVTCTP